MNADPMSIYYFAKKIAGNYINKGIDYDDLVQIAMVGAIKSCVKFNPSKGTLTTFAFRFIKDELNSACYRKVVVNGEWSRRQRFIESNISDEVLSILAKVSDKESPDSICEKAEFNELVKKKTKRLTERERTAFVDYYFNENYDSYIKKYNTTKHKAQAQAGHARLKIQEYLKVSLITGV